MDEERRGLGNMRQAGGPARMDEERRGLENMRAGRRDPQENRPSPEPPADQNADGPLAQQSEAPSAGQFLVPGSPASSLTASVSKDGNRTLCFAFHCDLGWILFSSSYQIPHRPDNLSRCCRKTILQVYCN